MFDTKWNAQSIKRYGTISIEINKNILLDRECFIYPFNFIFAWDIANNANKYSDLSTWDIVMRASKAVTNNEILIRRKIDLDKYLIQFHCFSSIHQKALDILNELGYSNSDLVIHKDHSDSLKGDDMNRNATALINGKLFDAVISEDGSFASIFNVISVDNSDLLGRFILSTQNELIEYFPMTNEKKVIGKLILNSNQSSVAISETA